VSILIIFLNSKSAPFTNQRKAQIRFVRKSTSTHKEKPGSAPLGMLPGCWFHAQSKDMGKALFAQKSRKMDLLWGIGLSNRGRFRPRLLYRR
jgi:hypothetical protein